MCVSGQEVPVRIKSGTVCRDKQFKVRRHYGSVVFRTKNEVYMNSGSVGVGTKIYAA